MTACSNGADCTDYKCMYTDGCTAAITHDGELYTWGDGAGGNLGYGNTLRQFIPRQVEKGLGDYNIIQVG
jgi:alpha-tubulin suppressor-like RCC1 family protein